MPHADFSEVEKLPAHQRALHRRIMRAIRAERGQRLVPRDERERWPGLINPQDPPDPTNREGAP